MRMNWLSCDTERDESWVNLSEKRWVNSCDRYRPSAQVAELGCFGIDLAAMSPFAGPRPLHENEKRLDNEQKHGVLMLDTQKYFRLFSQDRALIDRRSNGSCPQIGLRLRLARVLESENEL
jgi:hypothetical protein